MTVFESRCQRCKHKVAAYPAGFPVPAMLGDEDTPPIDHRQPHPGDHGLRWPPARPGLKHYLNELQAHYYKDSPQNASPHPHANS
ncbi:MAG: hypothetical protein WCI73_12530 [Phycisphaerae bacterium]